MIRVKDAREMVFRAKDDDTRAVALEEYYEAARRQIATDVYETLDRLSTELEEHGPVVALTLTLAVDRIAQVFED